MEFNKNEDQFKQLCAHVKSKAQKTMLGGGEKKIEGQHQKGKLTARERIEYLTDKDSNFLEIGLFAGEGMYKELGGCPSGGVITGIGYVNERQCVIVANDSTVKAGAWFPITAKKKSSRSGNLDGEPPTHYLLSGQCWSFSSHAG